MKKSSQTALIIVTCVVVASVTWRLKRCAEVDHTGETCTELFGHVQKYCSEPRAQMNSPI